MKALTKDSMSGLDKAAIFLMAIGQDLASKVVSNLPPREVEKIGMRISSLDNITRDLVEVSLADFLRDVQNQTALGVKTEEYMRTVLVNALGTDRAQELIDRITMNGRTEGLDSLRYMDSREIADLIREEHPQIIALVLSYLDGDQAGRVLSLMPEDLRADIVVRIANLEEITPHAIRELDRVLEQHQDRAKAHSGPSKPDDLGGIPAAAAIMNAVEDDVEEVVMERISEEDEDLSSAIRERMFVLEDLLTVDDRSIQTLLREVTTDDLVLALKGASDDMQTKILKNMSSRAAELLKDDMDAKGPVRLSEVEEAQRRICEVALRLGEEGKMVLAGGEDMV